MRERRRRSMKRLPRLAGTAAEAGSRSGRDPGEVSVGFVRSQDRRWGTGPAGAARMAGGHSLAGLGRTEREAGRRIGAGRSTVAAAVEIMRKHLISENSYVKSCDALH